MAVSVTHSTVATLPDEVGAEVNKAEWNAAHTVTGLGTMATETATDYLSVVTAASTYAPKASPTFTGIATFPDGAANAPPIHGSDSTGGIYFSSGSVAIGHSSALRAFWDATNYYLFPAGFNLTFSGASNGANDSRVAATAANSLRFSAAAATTTSRTEINKTVTAFTDAVAKATFTVTIPNAAHSAVIEFEFLGMLGAGGAIGAEEAVASNTYKVVVTRTAGVNAVASAVSAAWGAVAANVAGATTATCTAAVSAIAGAVGATNTFTMDVTITKAGGASAAHTCLCYAKLMNANASGITIA